MLLLAVVVHSTTVFSFQGYEDYIQKFNIDATKTEIYNIGESTLNASSEYNFDPVLILAVQKVESHFDIYAFNSWDARGLMQIRVSVWYKTLKKEGLMLSWKDFYNPERNIHSGTFILNTYRNECSAIKKGLKCALQRYNGDRKGDRYYKKVMKAVAQYYKMYHTKSIKLSSDKIINNIEDKKLKRIFKFVMSDRSDLRVVHYF